MNDRRNNNNAAGPSFTPPPMVDEIWEGEIARIESYGAFVSFGRQLQQQQRERRAWQGLVHISQLTESRVEKVEDVVEKGDNVWVKVLEVEKQESSTGGANNNNNPRYRIKLSMKDVSQDGTKEDLKQLRDEKEQVTTQLETNLNSMIGMALAIDPKLILSSRFDIFSIYSE